VKYTAFNLLWLLTLPAMAAGAWFSIRLAYADSLYIVNEPGALALAIQLEPGSAAYHALLAEHIEGQGADPKPELRRASILSPRNSLYLERLAVRAESEHDYFSAEKFLNQAAAVDNKLLPRWDLLNFYFRRGDDTNFWPWFRRSLEMSSIDDADGIFNLAWAHSQDPAAILKSIPPVHRMLQHYLGFLVQTGRLEPAAVVADRIASMAGEADVSELLAYCERALSSDSASAVRIWNALSARKLIPLAQLNPGQGSFIANRNFLPTTAPRAFDWVFLPVDGVYATQSAEADGVSIHFDGTESEDCIILRQSVPLIADDRYLVSYEFSSPGGSPVRGLWWDVISSRGVAATSPEMSANADWHPASFEFLAAGGWAELRLRYRRPAGAIRAEGTVIVRKLTGRLVK
jgi:tetratricopeptide (TPR) repeat protein